jgi:hypothetical protein
MSTVDQSKKLAYEQRAKTRRSNNNWWSYQEARIWVHNLQLKNIAAWNAYCKTENFPESLPACPKITYKKEWTGWTDWIGRNNRIKEFSSFEEIKRTFSN